jgi:hypothetical protein
MQTNIPDDPVSNTSVCKYVKMIPAAGSFQGRKRRRRAT